MGAIASPPDYRDLIARVNVFTPTVTAIENLPPFFHTDLGPKLDQNKTPACVSHNIVYLMKRYWYNKTGKWIKLSPRFLDILVKRIDGLNRETDGTWPRLVMKLATTVGCVTEDMLPNDTTLPILEYRNDDLVTDEMIAAAGKWKIPGFINIGTDFEATRNAVFMHHAVTSLFQIDSQFWTPSWSPEDINPLRVPKKVESGHQLAVVGWDSPSLNIGCNEWGVEWNLKGEFHYNHREWRDYIIEQWAVADVPKNIKEFLGQLPSPFSFHYQWNNNLKRGMVNNDVGMAQVAFMMLGYMKPIAPDEFGFFGAKTAQANYAFQTSNKVFPPSPDNIGPMTRNILNKKFA